MLGVVLAAGIVLAGSPVQSCDPECERQAAERLLEVGELKAAAARLKDARLRFPDDRQLVLLLARAYMLQDNLFWAERTIAEALETQSGDPELLAWLAAIHLRQGDPELAADDLDPELAPTADPLRSRWRLLGASRLQLSGDHDGARDLLDEAALSDVVFPEDMLPLQALRISLDPWWSPVLTGTVDLGGGHTSNALAGSPTDPGQDGAPSGLLMPQLRARFAPHGSEAVRAFVDVEVLGNHLFDEDAEEYSTVLGGIRPGIAVSSDRRRLSFGYRIEGLWLEEESGLYSEAHRVEAEIEWAAGRVLFGGFGHRDYSDEKRTRWEGDVGIGGSLGSVAGVPIVAGATVRLADAESDAYDQLGVSAAASSTFLLGGRVSLQVALSAIWDDYVNSGGAEGLLVFGTEEKRRDLLGRIGLILWGPQWRGLRPGLEVRTTRRDSTADEAPGFDFSFSEWRAVFWLRWTFSAGDGAPKVSAPVGHVPLDWGMDAGGGMEQERILDLLRRDEELRRGSSCSVGP
ncbi:MAG: tetratricopeptide repeat protein [Thermoanaerobaculales bacterium]|jgi:tetratricopeptide (TPR) repeat protein|nr:tetratricopeptide repeat protein [Thermoanaerobaculales bacterium]